MTMRHLLPASTLSIKLERFVLEGRTLRCLMAMPITSFIA